MTTKERPILFSGPMVKAILSYRAFFARRLMADVPELEGFFETRTSVADEDEQP